MKKQKILFIFTISIIAILTICILLFQHLYGKGNKGEIIDNTNQEENEIAYKVTPTNQITELEDGLSTVAYGSDYRFEQFLSKGGASSDDELVPFIQDQVLSGKVSLTVNQIPFGCSTLKSNQFFGRNFDWQECQALVIINQNPNDYKSISTVNTDFITNGTGFNIDILPPNVRSMIALYAPLDGMNEKGLAVSVNMIQDSETINQNTNKPDLTTTTVVRLLLNQAANVDEAIELLSQYDVHSSMGLMVHYAISDANGKSVVVEYIHNEMVVTNTPVVTNFYLAQGEKNGIGSSQSHERYEILMNALESNSAMTLNDMKNAMDSVSKDNFDEFESTEWTIIFDQTEGEVRYYHRENYQESFVFNIK